MKLFFTRRPIPIPSINARINLVFLFIDYFFEKRLLILVFVVSHNLAIPSGS